MKDNKRSKAELLKEVSDLRRQLTKLKKTEDVLRTSEERLRSLFETMAEGVVLIAPDGEIVNANPAAERILGLKRAEIEGRNYVGPEWKIIRPDGTTMPPEEMAGPLAMKEKRLVKDVVMGYKCPDGSISWINVSASPILNEAGKLTGVVGTFVDITKRKLAEAALCESEEKYRALAHNAMDGIYIINPEGFEYVNPAFEEIFGYKAEEVCHKDFNFFDLIYPEDRKIIAEREIARKKGKRLPSMYLFRVMTKDRKLKHVEVNTVPLPGKKVRILGILRDIKERMQAEKQVKASLREKEVLLRELHHRVKNNMQVISSILNLQSSRIKDKNVLEMFKKSRDRIRSMALIHEKLYQSKDFARIDLARYVQSLASHLFHSYNVDPNVVRLKTDVEDVFLDINTAIPCGLIINELVSNSIKHAFPKGRARGDKGKVRGEILISVHSDKNGQTTLLLADNGMGLPKDFDIRKTKSLGLQLVNDLANQLEGSIKLQRRRGTAFRITFSLPK